MILLSIQVPTTPDRRQLFKQLSDEIIRQCVEIGEEPIDSWKQMLHNPGGWHSEHIEFLWLEDNKEMTIGEKRNILYACSQGLYSWQIDSDDSIKNDAIKLIFDELQKYSPDTCTFGEYCNMDGSYLLSNHSLDYGDWEGDGQRLLPDGYHFHRTPFFKSVIKTEICQSTPIDHIRFGEDHKFAQAIKPKLISEAHIGEYLYFYNHQSSDFNERYGINREQ
jgi:hypothetical protein